MKDETSGTPITEFAGLRSKMYSYIKDDQKGVQKAKGIKKNVVKKEIKHEDYKNTLLNSEQTNETLNEIYPLKKS